MPLGTYSVTAEHSGFKKVEQKGVIPTVNQNVRVDLVLPVGDVAETVTATSDVTQVETRRASITHLMDQKRMTELPLNGRNPAALAVLIPGASTVSVPTRPGINGVLITINGTRNNAQQYLLDGRRLTPFSAATAIL